LSKFRTISHQIFMCCLLAFLLISCQALEYRDDRNSLTLFLEGAELQVETKDQLLEVERALQDILRLPPEELRKVRYSDYQMNEGVWTLPQLLSAYFLPQHPMGIDFDGFYSNAATDVSRATVKRKLTDLQSLEFD